MKIQNFNLERELRIARLVGCLVLLAVLIYQAVELPNKIGQYVSARVTSTSARVKPILDHFDGTVANIDDATQTAKGFVAELSDDYYNPSKPDEGFYWDFKNVTDRSSESSFATARLIAKLDSQLNGGKDPESGVPVPGVIPAARLLLVELTDAVQAGKDTLPPLKMALEHISDVSAELQIELAKGGNVDEVFARLGISILDFNKLLEDPSIQKIMNNSADTAQHLAGSAETLDIVMRPWRKKANQLKVILGKLAGMLKLVVPL